MGANEPDSGKKMEAKIYLTAVTFSGLIAVQRKQ